MGYTWSLGLWMDLIVYLPAITCPVTQYISPSRQIRVRGVQNCVCRFCRYPHLRILIWLDECG